MKRLFPSLSALMLSAAPAMAERVSVLVFDASGSMWNRVEGELTRIEVARDVMGDYFASRDGAVPLSVIAYGHNRREDCRDIEVIAPMGQTAPGTLEARLRALMPRGMTPLTDSLALARDQIPPTAEAADIILVTDGLETCKGDPCALAASLASEGIDIRAHVVGFGLSAVEVAALACITDQTGGMLFQTNSGAELARALQQVSASVPEPAPDPEASTDTVPVFTNQFVFRDIGTGTPRGRMDWRAEAPDGTVIQFGTTEGTLQSLEGLSADLPAGEWLIVAEGAEGRAERQMTLTQCCGRHGIPFTGTDMAAVIPPMGQVQAGMDARLAYEISHPGVGNLGGSPYQIIATGPEGALTPDQILRDDLITRRDPGIQGARTGELAPGTYRLLIAIARNGGYDIRAERSFEAVANPTIRVVAPDQALPGERVEVRFNGGYATRHHVTVVDENGRDVGQGNSLNRGPGGGSGGPVTMTIVMPNREGLFDIVVRPSSSPNDRGTVLARQPITISATPAPAQGQDALPPVIATFRLPPEVPQTDVTWSALPLDPDMTSGPWTPTDTGPAITGSFEPGNWRITATAPGEVTLSADVPIFPGQANDFTVQIDASGDEDHGALNLQGPWRIMTLPPHDVPPGTPIDPMKIMDVVLQINATGDGYQGRFTPAPAAFGTVLFEREIDSVVEEDGALVLTMVLPMVDPAPFVLSVLPAAEGYAGTLAAGANSLPVVFWPDAVPLPSSARLQVVLYGPNPAEEGHLQHGVEVVFTCAQAICAWTDPASGLTIPLPMGWSVTSPEFETASATPTSMDLPSLSLFGPDGQELRLNPRQWLDSNGTCLETSGLGRLCQFADADITAQMVAGMVAPMIHLGQPAAGARVRPVSLTLPGVPRDANYELEITLVAGEDARHAGGQHFFGAMSLQDHLLGVGNVYDIRAVSGTREYRDRNVTITPGSAAQDVVLAPVFLWDEVTLEFPDTPIVAAPGTFFPVTLTAPADFNGLIAIHDADDRDAPAIFSVRGADLMGAQDPVLPVPERPGFYEIQFQDMNGEMFGGADLEVVAADTDHGNAAPQGSVSLALLSDRDLLAGSGGFFPVDIVAPAGLAGQLQIEAQGGALVHSTALAPLIASQDPSLPIPDAPGIYMISIIDQAGMLRATTSFEVRANADQAGRAGADDAKFLGKGT